MKNKRKTIGSSVRAPCFIYKGVNDVGQIQLLIDCAGADYLC